MLSMLIGLSLLVQVEPSHDAAAAPTPAPAVAPAAPAPAPAPAKTLHLAAGTELQVELVDPLSSATAHLGDKFALRLVTPIVSDGVEIVHAGALGDGEVIDAAHSGMAGKAGKLIISSRHLDLNGHSVRIRGMTLMLHGTPQVGVASGVMWVPYVGITAAFIEGSEVVLPAGARYTVKLGEDVDLPVTTN